MANTRVEFYFDYLSPYAYLAWLSVPHVCSARGIELAPRPVVLGALLQHWGQLGPAEIPPKALFTFKDCVRRAHHLGHPFRAPAYHPFNPLTALRVSLSEVAGAAQRDVMNALWQAGWGEGRDLGSAQEIADILNQAGLAGTALVARASDPEVKALLKANTEGAIQQGVFGVPTMLVGEELFWGADQLDALGMYLDGRDPLKAVPLESLAPRGASAQRKRAQGTG